MLDSSIISFLPLSPLLSVCLASLAWSLEANRGLHFYLLIGCLTGQCWKAINGEKHFCPVSSIGLQEKCQPKAMVLCAGKLLSFSVSHVTVYSFRPALHNCWGANYLPVCRKWVRPLQLFLHLMPAFGFSSVLSNVLCAKKRGSPKVCEVAGVTSWYLWRVPSKQLRDNGRLRLQSFILSTWSISHASRQLMNGGLTQVFTLLKWVIPSKQIGLTN